MRSGYRQFSRFLQYRERHSSSIQSECCPIVLDHSHHSVSCRLLRWEDASQHIRNDRRYCRFLYRRFVMVALLTIVSTIVMLAFSSWIRLQTNVPIHQDIMIALFAFIATVFRLELIILVGPILVSETFVLRRINFFRGLVVGLVAGAFSICMFVCC
jgi:hypothetical protein